MIMMMIIVIVLLLLLDDDINDDDDDSGSCSSSSTSSSMDIERRNTHFRGQARSALAPPPQPGKGLARVDHVCWS